mmetsp:Transcript_60679/g.112576  ORF Transcript_60679/g.112576 Transcript_60679/m.112576 type:complete len:212 (-) Transcript_60679:194-829(-)
MLHAVQNRAIRPYLLALAPLLYLNSAILLSPRLRAISAMASLFSAEASCDSTVSLNRRESIAKALSAVVWNFNPPPSSQFSEVCSSPSCHICANVIGLSGSSTAGFCSLLAMAAFEAATSAANSSFFLFSDASASLGRADPLSRSLKEAICACIAAWAALGVPAPVLALDPTATGALLGAADSVCTIGCSAAFFAFFSAFLAAAFSTSVSL